MQLQDIQEVRGQISRIESEIRKRIVGMDEVIKLLLVGADVDVPLLERAWSEVVRRHESLRTSFHMGADGQLRQIVHEPTIDAAANGPQVRMALIIVTIFQWPPGTFAMTRWPFGARPRVGRFFDAGDGGASTHPAVVSHRFWSTHLGATPAALGRDVAIFAEHDYELSAIRAFDLFPMTHHVECVALLERTGSLR